MKILVINGPNINMLGIREPEVYGNTSYAALLELLDQTATELHVEIEQFQSNHEGAIIDTIQSAYGVFDGIIINPAAYTHTSVAIRDAIAAAALPAVEVHLSNIMSRESFRHESLTAPVCIGVVAGFGAFSYELALRALAKKLLPECADPKNTSSR